MSKKIQLITDNSGKWMSKISAIVNEYNEGEPLDGDEVDTLCEIIKAKINLHQGNLTESEYNDIIKTIK